MKYKDAVKIIKKQIKSAKNFGLSTLSVDEYIKMAKMGGIKIDEK